MTLGDSEMHGLSESGDNCPRGVQVEVPLGYVEKLQTMVAHGG